MILKNSFWGWGSICSSQVQFPCLSSWIFVTLNFFHIWGDILVHIISLLKKLAFQNNGGNRWEWGCSQNHLQRLERQSHRGAIELTLKKSSFSNSSFFFLLRCFILSLGSQDGLPLCAWFCDWQFLGRYGIGKPQGIMSNFCLLRDNFNLTTLCVSEENYEDQTRMAPL